MASSYLAPGVYGEEVPSAERPIAGVGTNTVGFIGIVPSTITYPVPNPNFDPVAARFALRQGAVPEKTIADAIEVKRTALDQVTAALEAKTRERDASQGATATLPGEIAALEANPARSEDDERQLKEKKQSLATARKAHAGLDAQVQELRDQAQGLKKAVEGLEAVAGQPGGAAPGAAAPARTQPAPDEVSGLLPYILRQFTVTAEPCVTKLCTNFTEYTARFGPFSADNIDGTPMSPEHRALTHAVNGFFKNGGTRCFVARLEGPEQLQRALTMFESIEELSIIAVPGLAPELATWDELLAFCDTRKTCFAVLDSQQAVEDAQGDLDVRQLGTGGEKLPPPNKNAAFYFPHIEVMDPARALFDSDPARNVEPKHRGRVMVPPSGHICGVYARTDEERGVHKAPANVQVRGALNVRYYVSKPKQALLNPQGVNCIRNINGAITVYGGRTSGGDANNEFKYVSVRRTFLFLLASIDRGTQWIVFEPNDHALWGKIILNVTAFLTNVWRNGALFGRTAEEAFYVKCDAELNPPEVRDIGQVVTEIGVAIVRPAEFVIFRLTQSSGQPQG